jgi:hypothetical protein
MPQPLGRVVSHVCPGGSASVRFRVTNCGIETEAVRVNPAGTSLHISVDPEELTLGPLEDGSIDAVMPVPDDASSGDALQTLLWVRGCRDHYLRWVVKVGGGGCCDSLHEVSVDDCPDLMHHWYDHFYCAHPCTHRKAEHDG